ncbi:PREDICTED: galactosylgalactosylxylosylprotein 3-beta-glucuronosyltransferase S-like isoform X1 [Papilio polytes]|uniref:galactosylgalactosylxylosylprotein 3-beta-glucuronosyltransferase S-like isoform X1 n=1 Tax=Papilio polytes TaxID=76194 RepID=UPI000675F321|nr:PREDICTED: galactosylgalactosylxylosylprotein 3-beta-glucuronosyltransferase S-like isoform X1 [Papilio polytes]
MKSIRIAKKTLAMAVVLSIIWFLLFWSYLGILSFENVGSKAIPVIVKNKLCSVNYGDYRTNVNNNNTLKMIYFVTPTYPRPEQVPELTRLAHTLMHVPRIHWIIADDQPLCSNVVLNILRRTYLPFTLISSPKPFIYKGTNFPRGVSNRRAAVTWLQENVSEGILYFGDDDNTVDLELFDEIRNTKKVSMFPVGLIGGYGVSSPVVKNGKVAGFFDSWPGSRTFPVDMAGFAVNIKFLKPKASMPYIAGHEEDKFLVSLDLKMEDIEPLADNCTRILVWHTKTAKYKKPTVKIDLKQFDGEPKFQNFVNLLKETSRLGMANIESSNGTKPYIIRDRKSYETLTGLQ